MNKPAVVKQKGVQGGKFMEFTCQTGITFGTGELKALKRLKSNVQMEMLEEG